MTLLDDVPRRVQMQARSVDAAIGFRHDLDVDIRRPGFGLGRRRVERNDMAAPDLVQLGGVRRLDIVGAPIHPVDDEMQPVAQLVASQPLGEHPADDRLGDLLAVGGVLGRAALVGEAVVGQRPVHGLDDVAPLAHLAQGRLGLRGYGPAADLHLGRQPHALQLPGAGDQQPVEASLSQNHSRGFGWPTAH